MKVETLKGLDTVGYYECDEHGNVLDFDFNYAIRLLDLGHVVIRKSMQVRGDVIIYKQIPACVELDRIDNMQSLPPDAKNIIKAMSKDRKPNIKANDTALIFIDSYIIVSYQGIVRPWLPTGEDINSTDWVVLEP